MKTIKIIDILQLDTEGVKSRMKNGKPQTVHLRQGDLDGACAVYSTMMVLIMIGAVKHKDIMLSGRVHNGRESIGRLKKEMFETSGLHRDGNYFYDDNYDGIKDMLQRSFSKVVTSKYIKHVGIDMSEVIREQIESNQPLMIQTAFKGGAHAIVAVGIEYDADGIPSKILCLDPGHESPKYTYWNSVVDLKPQKGKYNCRYITNTGNTELVQLQDVLIISKK